MFNKADVLANQGFWAMKHGSRTDSAMLPESIFLLIKGSGKCSIDYQIQKKLKAVV